MPDAGSTEPEGLSDKDRELLRRLRESNYNQKPFEENDDDDGEAKMTPEPETPTPEDQQRFPRPFSEVQENLTDLIDHPNPQKEGELKLERARLIRAAKDQGIFNTLKGAIADIQLNNSPSQALQKTDEINVAELENFESGVHGWNEAYRGMLDEYRNVAVLNMELAMRKARVHARMEQPDDEQTIDELKREIDVRGWGLPPQGLEASARKFLRERAERRERRQAPREPQPPQGNFARDFVTEMNRRDLERAKKLRKNFPFVEESGAEEINIPFLQSEIWEGLTESERKLWQARLKLSNGRAHIQAAFKAEDLFPNVSAMSLSKEDLNNLTNNSDASRAFIIYLALSRAGNADDLNQDISPSLQAKIAERHTQIQEVEEHNRHIGRRLFGKSEKPREVPREIKRFYDIDDDETLAHFREDVIEYFIFALGMNSDNAVASEHIAFNLCRNLFVLEATDEEPKSQITLSQVGSSAVRNLMHPEANLVDFLGKNRVWPPNILGTFAKNNKDKYMKKGGPDGKTVMFGKESLMPKKLLLNPLEKMQKKDEGKIIEVTLSDGRTIALDEFINNREEELRTQRRDVTIESLCSDVTGINWDNLDENPFQGYYIGQVNSAIIVNAVLTTGDLPNGKGYGDLENALNALKINDRAMRRRLVYIIENKKQNWINPKNDRFEPTKNSMYMRGFWAGFNQDHPTFFNVS